MRNLLGTLLLSTGVPMLNAGDEFGRSQRGNNNPYSQDNEISWMAWELEPWQQDLLETTRHLVRLRQEHPVLRQRSFFSGRQVHEDGSTDLAWFGTDGQPMGDRWGRVVGRGRAGALRRRLARSAHGAAHAQRLVARGRGHPAHGTRRERHTSCSGTVTTTSPLPRRTGGGGDGRVDGPGVDARLARHVVRA